MRYIGQTTALHKRLAYIQVYQSMFKYRVGRPFCRRRRKKKIYITRLKKAHESQDWEAAATLTVELRYWSNLDNAIKEWEPGKPILLTH